MSERRTQEYVTKEGRGQIHTRVVSDDYRDGWDRVFGRRDRIEWPGVEERRGIRLSDLDPDARPRIHIIVKGAK